MTNRIKKSIGNFLREKIIPFGELPLSVLRKRQKSCSSKLFFFKSFKQKSATLTIYLLRLLH